MISSAYFSLLRGVSEENFCLKISTAKSLSVPLPDKKGNLAGLLENSNALESSVSNQSIQQNFLIHPEIIEENIFSKNIKERRDSGFSEGNLMPAADFLQKNYLAINHEQQGMPAEHIDLISKYAQKNNLIIAFRPVEPAAKSLLAEGGYPTKHFHIKAKSSNCGPTAGFIPVLLKFSKSATANKLPTNALDKLLYTLSQFTHSSIHSAVAGWMRGWLEKAREVLQTFLENQEQEGIATLLKSGSVVKIPLKLSAKRLNELISNGLIKIENNNELISLFNRKLDRHISSQRNIREESGFIICSSGENNRLNYFKVSKAEDEDCYIIYDENGRNVEVLADGETKKPFIPDYDLLFVAPSIEQMSDQDNMVSVLDLKKTQVINHYSSSEASEFGNTTQRIIKKIIPGLNKALNEGLKRELGSKLIHHGADEGNPASKPESNYPVTIFLPKPIAGLALVLMVENHADFAQFVKIGVDANYCVKVNPLWEERPVDGHARSTQVKLGEIRRESFISAKDKLEDFFNKRKRASRAVED